MDDALGRRLEELTREVASLREENQRLRARLEALEEENRQLRERAEEAERAAARQAAPFRRPQERRVPLAEHRRPGRKPGHAGSWRPAPAQVDERLEVPLSACPSCGGPVEGCRRLDQYIEEIPPVRPRVVHLVTYEGHCARCGDVASRHPLQTTTARGAAGVHLGPRAQALAVLLNKALGLTMGRTCRVLREVAGLCLSRGGLAQLVARAARRVQGDYEALQACLRGRPAVFADETSWWVGGPGWWLWTFTTPQETLYRVDRSRGSPVVADVLGSDFAGMLVSDCLATYDPAPYRKHKCLAHHLRALAKAREAPGTPDPAYLDSWRHVFQAALALHRTRAEMAPEAFADLRAALHARCEDLLAHPGPQPGDRAIHQRLFKQRDHLLGCLDEPAAEPTNNRAERALRPAVIARKLSCGNKTEAGRDAWQVLTSLAATCAQRAQDFVTYLASRLSLATQQG